MQASPVDKNIFYLLMFRNLAGILQKGEQCPDFLEKRFDSTLIGRFSFIDVDHHHHHLVMVMNLFRVIGKHFLTSF
jgi:hypothetical protein